MLDKGVQDISEADLQALIREEEPERKKLEFKRQLPGKSEGERKEFLYDVSSLANASGGFLLYGLDEQDGRAKALPGIAGINGEDEKLALESSARDGIRPPIVGIESSAIRLANGNIAIIMRIPKSWNAPHQVTYGKAFRFYGRASNGKYPLDVDELRSVFAVSGEVAERMRQFRMARLARIDSGELPLAAGARLITHAMPFSAFGSGQAVPIELIAERYDLFGKMIGGFSQNRFNVDGYLVADGQSDLAYAQIFSNGCIEIARVFPDNSERTKSGPALPSKTIDYVITSQITGIKEALEVLRLAPPVAVALSLMGAKDWVMAVGPEYSSSRKAFDRDPVVMPEALLQSFRDTSASDAAPIIRAIWRAAGWPDSIYK